MSRYEYTCGDYINAIRVGFSYTKDDLIAKNERYLASIFANAAGNDCGRYSERLEVNDESIFLKLVAQGMKFLKFAKNNPDFEADIDVDRDGVISSYEIERVVDKANESK